jgi:hypothetical protein
METRNYAELSILISTKALIKFAKELIKDLENESNVKDKINDITEKIELDKTKQKNIKNTEFPKDKINNNIPNNTCSKINTYKDDCKEDYVLNKKSGKYEYKDPEPNKNKYIEKKDNVGDTTTCKCCSCNNKKTMNNSDNVSSNIISIRKKDIKEIKKELQKIREIFDEYPIKPGCLVNEALSMKGKIKIDSVLEFFSKTLKV